MGIQRSVVKQFSKLLAVLVCCFIFVSKIGNASQSSPHYLMGTLGDSISVAFMADTSLKDYDKYQNFHYIPNLIDLNPSTTDSVMLIDNRWTLSWSSGNQIASHYMFMNWYLNRTEPRAKLDVQNFAMTGSITYDVIAQADKLVAAAASTINGVKKYDSLKYVTLLIGANDACKQISNSIMRTSLLEVFKRLSQIKQTESIKILVSGMPRIPDVGLPEVQYHKTFGGMTCHFLQSTITHACQGLTSWASGNDYADKLKYTIEKNAVIEATVAEARVKFAPSLDIFFSGKVFNGVVTPDDLAIECFHPNARAQEQLSKALWSEIPWFR